MTHKLDATVFVYRHRGTKEIKTRYLEDARELDGREGWEHVATLEPRMWLQYHYDDMIRERQLCADLCRSLAPSQRELNRVAYDFCNLCADEIERRGEVQEIKS